MATENGDSAPIETPVLIIGSSMVGMTLSALLAKQGIRGCITVEKHASTAIHPRAALFHPRTMQIYRELGLYDRMRTESLKSYDEHAGVFGVESLAGKHLRTYMGDMNAGIDQVSPVSRLFLTQQMFEPILRECAIEHGAKLLFSTEMVGFEQDESGVTAKIRSLETGHVQTVRAKYMVAADGSKSKVREKLGISMKGHGMLSESITIYFKANLGPFIAGKYNGVIYVVNDLVRGFYRLNKTGDEGFLVVSTWGDKFDDKSRFPSADMSEAKAAEILRASIGADVPFEITYLSPWTARCDVAERFSVGRVLLAGDAAHVNTPHGGYGGNTGIQDAHNLAWKLAATLEGKAGPELVEKTYNEERQPVCEKTVDQVFAHYLDRTDPELTTSKRWLSEEKGAGNEPEEQVPESTWLELGYRYHSQAVSNEPLSSVVEDPKVARAAPGSLAHHVYISTKDRPGDRIPLAEILNGTFVLVTGENAQGWKQAVESVPELRDFVRCHELAAGQNSAFYEKYAITEKGCVLIRPDAVVAWSSLGSFEAGESVSPASGVLQQVFGRLLCQSNA